VTTAIKLKKATFKHIESELYSYKDTLKEIEFIRNNIMFCKEEIDENVGGGRASLPGKPTENIATRLATHRRLTKLEEIANAIEKVYVNLPETHQKLIQLRYWTRPQRYTWEGIAEQLHVNRATAFRWRDQIINSIAEVLGWR
jgi:RinA family phage transcriptional activator